MYACISGLCLIIKLVYEHSQELNICDINKIVKGGNKKCVLLIISAVIAEISVKSF